MGNIFTPDVSKNISTEATSNKNNNFGDVLGAFIAPESTVMTGDTAVLSSISSKGKQDIVNQLLSQILVPMKENAKDGYLTPAGGASTLDPNKMLQALAAKTLLNQDANSKNLNPAKTLADNSQNILSASNTSKQTLPVLPDILVAIPSHMSPTIEAKALNAIEIKDAKKILKGVDLKEDLKIEIDHDVATKKDLLEKVLSKEQKSSEHEHKNDTGHNDVSLSGSIVIFKEAQQVAETAKTETVKYLTKSLESYMDQKYQPTIIMKNDAFTIKLDGSIMLDARMARIDGQWQLQMDVSGRNSDVFIQKSAMLHERLSQLGITGVIKKMDVKKEA